MPNQTINTTYNAPDWQSVSVSKWQQSLMQLSESAIEPKDRLYWMLTFRDWIKVNAEQIQFAEPQMQICLSMMNQLAYRLCDWYLMIEIYQLNINAVGEHSATEIDQQTMVDILHCGVAYWQLGQLDNAKTLLEKHLSKISDDSPLHQFYYQVVQDIASGPIYLVSEDNPALSLSPLEEQHLSSFSWVYQDSQIAALCNLPEFENDEQWYQWLSHDQVNDNKQVFAVNHQHWGFIGVVSIEVHAGVGFFYYWLGQDFQGGGLGPQAVKILLDMAEKDMAMKCCYAKVYRNNIASQKAMSKLEFKPTPFEIEAPNDDQMYFYRGEQKPYNQWRQELVDLAAITDIDSKILL